MIPWALVSVNNSVNSCLVLNLLQEMQKSQLLNRKIKSTHPTQLKWAWLNTWMDVPLRMHSLLTRVRWQSRSRKERTFLFCWSLLLHVCSLSGARREKGTLCNYSCNHPSSHRISTCTSYLYMVKIKKICGMPAEDSATWNPFVEVYRVSPRQCIFHASFVDASICGCEMTAGGLFIW